MRRVWVTVILSSLLTACAGLLPFNPVYSAWYIQYEDKDGKGAGSTPKLYVALLNRDINEIKVQDVILNRDPTGWKLNGFPSSKDGKPTLLEPGKLVVFQAQAFKKGGNGESFDKPCLVPVEVAVVLAEEQHWSQRWIRKVQGDPDGMIRADLVGRMPSELPTNWEVACALPTVPPKA